MQLGHGQGLDFEGIGMLVQVRDGILNDDRE